MINEDYQRTAGAVVGITMETLNSVGVECGSPREGAARKRLWNFLDRNFRSGSYILKASKQNVLKGFAEVMKAIDVPKSKQKLVLDALGDEIENNFGDGYGNE